ncbi:MAG: hypothetical protein WCS73_00665 [Lentisphaeria bacterium]
MQKIRIFLALLLFGAVSMVSALTVESILGKDGSFFKMADGDVFLSANSPYYRYFRWVSGDRYQARYPGWKNSPRDLTFADQTLAEALFRFDKDRSLKSIDLSIFNRGDNGDIPYAQFEDQRDKIKNHISSQTKQPSVRKTGKLASGMRIERQIWIADGLAYVLRSSMTKGRSKKENRPEFIQLEIKPFDPNKDPRKTSVQHSDRSAIQSKKDLVENVVRQRNNTVFIDHIPMVDQGEKGYCVVAATERVMRYFGINTVNQHLLAQLTSSSRQEGTSIDAMLEAVGDAGSKLGVYLSEEYCLIEDYNDVKHLVRDYNRQARRNDVPKVEIVQFGNQIDVLRTISSMDPKTYIQIRSKSRDVRNFKKLIQKNIDKGLPLAWSVFLGIVPEINLKQAIGGHLRLIIGYNFAADKIIYSDSWGAGHEKKEMDLKNACAITQRILLFRPR